jgi:hypothetical protein
LLRCQSFKPVNDDWKNGSRDWTCTSTIGALDAVPLLLGYATIEKLQ